jgi:hypothetical protein
MEIRTKRNITPTTIPNIGMNTKTSVNVLQNNEFMVKQNRQNIFPTWKKGME